MQSRSQFIIIPALTVILVGLVVYFFFFRKEVKDYLPAAFALPDNAVVIYQGKDLQKQYASLAQTDFYKFLGQNIAVKEFDQDFRYFDSVFSSESDFKKLLVSRPLLISLHVTGNNNFQLLFLNQTEDELDHTSFNYALKEIHPDYGATERVFEGVKIYDIKDPRKNNIFSYTIIEGILALSRNPILVEDAIAAYLLHKSKSSALLDKIVESREKEKLFINYEQLPRLVSTYLGSDIHTIMDKLRVVGTFSDYDWKFESGKMALNGSVQTSADKKHLWDILPGQQPQKLKASQILPMRTAMYMNWGVSDFQKYYNDYTEFLKNTDSFDAYTARREKTEADQSINLDNDFIKWLGNEWAYSLREPVDENDTVGEMLIIKPINTTEATDVLTQVNERIRKQNLTSFKPENYRNYKIDKAAFKGVFDLLYGELFANFKAPYYTVVGDYIVFSDNIDMIQRSVDAYLDNQTLEHSPFWKKFMQNFGAESNFMFYLNSTRSLPLAYRYVRENFREQFKQNYPVLRGFSHFGFQLVANEKNLFNRIVTTHTGAENQSSEMLWSLPLEAQIVGKPTIVLNPKEKQKEIFVSDEANNVYLISASGNILWKKKLDDPVAGEVQQIDLYDNGELQYLFATKNNLYLLDREGKDVGNYPLGIGARATSDLALFDFNNNKKYQYLIGTQNNRIYGYYANGKPVSGWNPQITDAPIVLPIKYFTLKQETYIFAVSNRGTLYVWKQNGERAIKPIETNNRFLNPFKMNFAASLEQCSFYSVDTAGIMYQIKLNGDIDKYSFDLEGTPVFFDFTDVDGNGKNDFIISRGNTINAYEKEGKPMWNINAVSELQLAPQFFKINNNNWIGYTSTLTNQVFLVSRAGTIYKNFPLTGSSQFIIDDIYNDGQLELVTGGEGKMLYMYRISKQ